MIAPAPIWRVHPDKILKYLLSDTSPVGHGKNKFFRAAGYQPAACRILESDLCAHPTLALLTKTATTPHGNRVTYRCHLPPSPNGKQYRVLTVWEQRQDGAFWLVTAYPQPNPAPRSHSSARSAN